MTHIKLTKLLWPLLLIVPLIFPTTIYAVCGTVQTVSGGSFPVTSCITGDGSDISPFSSCASGSVCCSNESECPSNNAPNLLEGPNDQFFDNLNPLTNPALGGDPDIGAELATPGDIVSRVLVFALPLSGMILFVMMLWGGFEILAGSAGKKSLDAGKQRITAAIIGFILLFVSYWIVQILEVIFGIAIL